MKRYFFTALVVVSASITSISAFAACPMAAAKAKQTNIAQGTQVPEGTPENATGKMAPARQAPAAPPAQFVAAQPETNNFPQ